ncbi:MAG: EAL domain-containing protein [Candidatus Accumulibacter sp.]|jgi:diguanylate cyclase (GGDEF)-like protein/PAS domain S-box-containing protein|nr:EAL domain-containing protein [Accumulibacter sp.]
MTPQEADRLLLENGNEIVILVDLASLEIQAANGAAARLLGYAREALVGRPITDIVCALTDIFYWEDVRRGIVGGVNNVETSYLRADGELLNVYRSIVQSPTHPGTLVVSAVPTERLRRSENELANTVGRLNAAMEATADGILLLDRNGAIANMNRRFAEIWKIPEAPLLDNDDRAVFEHLALSMGDRDAYARRLAEILPDDANETYDLLALADGRFIERKSRPARLGQKIIGRVFSFSDVSADKAKEAQLKLAASVFSHAHEGIMITDAAGDIVDVNVMFCNITGYTRDEVIGQNPRFLKSGVQSEDFYRAMWKDLLTHGHWEGEIWNRLKSGKLYAERLSITTVECDAAPHYVAILSDITKIKEHEQLLERLAYHDALTGVANRALLADRLKLAIAQARRYQRCVALVYLDIDEFKGVNDAYGHDMGDQLLITVARHLRDALREGDTLARLGGDEFVVVITDLDGWSECKPILARLLGVVAAPIDIQNHTFRLSASMGVTLFPQDSGDADTLLRHADQAMYEAKQAGRNRYQLFDTEKEWQTRKHYRNVDRIGQAIARDEFELYYQPKVNMRTGAVIGAEALIRWRHPDRGLVLPGDFLPLVEGSDLMGNLDDWVMNAALRQMAAWREEGQDIAVSVNVSAFQLQQSDFLPQLEKRLAAYPAVAPGRLELEVLETAALEGISRISNLIENCQTLGVRFSLDDFGTGYSSLTYLRRLPADTLKIDQSFVRDMLWDASDLAIVEGIIGLAEAFRRAVIAEGVETPEHGAALLRLGCDLAQGYGIARPMPARELPVWIANWRAPEAWLTAPRPPAHEIILPVPPETPAPGGLL